jgi:hypothetical protein
LATTILISVISSLLTGILSTLLTIYLTPRARHAFWSRERITEVRLATYDKVNGITATIYIAEPALQQLAHLKPLGFGEPLPLSPWQNVLASLMAARDEVRNRFSESALLAYEKLEGLVTAQGVPAEKRVQYSETRDAVLQQLHAESLGEHGI